MPRHGDGVKKMNSAYGFTGVLRVFCMKCLFSELVFGVQALLHHISPLHQSSYILSFLLFQLHSTVNLTSFQPGQIHNSFLARIFARFVSLPLLDLQELS